MGSKKKKAKAKSNSKRKPAIQSQVRRSQSKRAGFVESFKEKYPRLSGALSIAYKGCELLLMLLPALIELARRLLDAGAALPAVLTEAVSWFFVRLDSDGLLTAFTIFAIACLFVFVLFFILGIYGFVNDPEMRSRNHYKSNGLPVYPFYTLAVLVALVMHCRFPGSLLLIHIPNSPVIGAVLIAAGLVLLCIARIKLGGKWGICINRVQGAGGLVTDGLYSVVRHPIYLATGVMYAGFSLVRERDHLARVGVGDGDELRSRQKRREGAKGNLQT